MLYYDRIDVSEEIDLAKTNNRFFNHGFNLKDYVCNDCHDLTMLSVIISNIAIMTVKNVDCRCIIHNITKSEAIILLESAVLENRGYI